MNEAALQAELDRRSRLARIRAERLEERLGDASVRAEQLQRNALLQSFGQLIRATRDQRRDCARLARANSIQDARWSALIADQPEARAWRQAGWPLEKTRTALTVLQELGPKARELLLQGPGSHFHRAGAFAQWLTHHPTEASPSALLDLVSAGLLLAPPLVQDALLTLALDDPGEALETEVGGFAWLNWRVGLNLLRSKPAPHPSPFTSELPEEKPVAVIGQLPIRAMQALHPSLIEELFVRGDDGQRERLTSAHPELAAYLWARQQPERLTLEEVQRLRFSGEQVRRLLEPDATRRSISKDFRQVDQTDPDARDFSLRADVLFNAETERSVSLPLIRSMVAGVRSDCAAAEALLVLTLTGIVDRQLHTDPTVWPVALALAPQAWFDSVAAFPPDEAIYRWTLLQAARNAVLHRDTGPFEALAPAIEDLLTRDATWVAEILTAKALIAYRNEDPNAASLSKAARRRFQNVATRRNHEMIVTKIAPDQLSPWHNLRLASGSSADWEHAWRVLRRTFRASSEELLRINWAHHKLRTQQSLGSWFTFPLRDLHYELPRGPGLFRPRARALARRTPTLTPNLVAQFASQATKELAARMQPIDASIAKGTR